MVHPDDRDVDQVRRLRPLLQDPDDPAGAVQVDLAEPRVGSRVHDHVGVRQHRAYALAGRQVEAGATARGDHSDLAGPKPGHDLTAQAAAAPCDDDVHGPSLSRSLDWVSSPFSPRDACLMYVPAHFAAISRRHPRPAVQPYRGRPDHPDRGRPTGQHAAADLRADRRRAGALLGHLARNNPQWSTPVLGEALAILRGPEAYITPSWYAAKARHGRVVPTWNYTIAHVYGTWSSTTTRPGSNPMSAASPTGTRRPSRALVGRRRPRPLRPRPAPCHRRARASDQPGRGQAQAQPEPGRRRHRGGRRRSAWPGRPPQRGRRPRRPPRREGLGRGRRSVAQELDHTGVSTLGRRRAPGRPGPAARRREAEALGCRLAARRTRRWVTRRGRPQPRRTCITASRRARDDPYPCRPFLRCPDAPEELRSPRRAPGREAGPGSGADWASSWAAGSGSRVQHSRSTGARCHGRPPQESRRWRPPPSTMMPRRSSIAAPGRRGIAAVPPAAAAYRWPRYRPNTRRRPRTGPGRRSPQTVTSGTPFEGLVGGGVPSGRRGAVGVRVGLVTRPS